MKPFGTQSLAEQYLEAVTEDRPCSTLFYKRYPDKVIVLTRDNWDDSRGDDYAQAS